MVPCAATLTPAASVCKRHALSARLSHRPSGSAAAALPASESPSLALQGLRYGQSCLLSLFYVAISVVLSQDTNVGARIMGCAGLLGPAWIGLVMTGALVRQSAQISALINSIPRLMCYLRFALFLLIVFLKRLYALMCGFDPRLPPHLLAVCANECALVWRPSCACPVTACAELRRVSTTRWRTPFRRPARRAAASHSAYSLTWSAQHSAQLDACQSAI